MLTNNFNQIRQGSQKAAPAIAILLSIFTAQAAHQVSSASRPAASNRSMPASRPFSQRSNAVRQPFNAPSSYRRPTPSAPSSHGVAQKAPTISSNTQTHGTKTPGNTGTTSAYNNPNRNTNINTNTNTNINRNTNLNSFNNGGRGAANSFNGTTRPGLSPGSGRNSNAGWSASNANSNLNRNTNINRNTNTNININRNTNVSFSGGRAGGGRIPEGTFRTHFGSGHEFHMGSPVDMGGHSGFQFGGVSFALIQPWPVGWMNTDAVYVDNFSGSYYLCNRMHPGMRVALNIGACAACAAAQMPPSDCTDCTADNSQADPTAAPTLYAGETTDQVVAALGTPQNIVDLGGKQIYLFASMKVTFVGGMLTDAQ